ncbi:hypothetical protein BDF19DRAFT_424089 [Syncephalis fuscata]|nr:hypothetical protein BDF19DRAFT_424089 [Syncephalis fuscata]
MSDWKTTWTGDRPTDIVPPPGMTLIGTQATPTAGAATAATPPATDTSSSAQTTSTPSSGSSSSSSSSSPSTPTNTASSSPSVPSVPAVAAPTTPTPPTGETVTVPSFTAPTNGGSGSSGTGTDVRSNAAIGASAEDNASSGSAAVGGIVGGAIGALLLAIIVVGLFVYRRRRRHDAFSKNVFGAGAANGIFPATVGRGGSEEKGFVNSNRSSNENTMFTRQLPPSSTAYNNVGNASSSIAAGAVAAAAAASRTPGFLQHKSSLNRAPAPISRPNSPPTAAGTRALPPLPTLEIREHRTGPPPPLQISGPVWSPNGSPKHNDSSVSNSTTTLDSEPATPHRLRLSNVNARRVSDSYSDLPSPMNNSGHVALTIHTEVEEERVGMDSDEEDSDRHSKNSSRDNLPVPESPLTRRLSTRKKRGLSYNMGDSFDPTIASAVAAASRIESGEMGESSSVASPTLSDMATAVLNASLGEEGQFLGLHNLDNEPLDPPARHSLDNDSVSSNAPSHFMSPRGPLTAVSEEGEASGSMPLRDNPSTIDRAATLSKLMSENFNPELMFGIPTNMNAPPRAGRSNTNGDNDDDDGAESGNDSASNRRGSVGTIATRFDEPRTPSFVRRDSAFFPQDY